MKKLLFTSMHRILLFLFLHFSGLAQVKAIDEIIHREMNERKIPGLQIAVVRNGEIDFCKSYGIANLQDSIRVDNRSVFAINSITKVFTGVAIMQLVDKGLLKLSNPVVEYLDIVPQNWSAVTINHLLTHTSGLPDVLRLIDQRTGGMGALRTEEAVWDTLRKMPVDFVAGERYSYNQTNGDLLGKLIDTYSGKSFAENFQEEQFRVAGMKNTVFGDSRDVIPHFAPTYFWRNFMDGRSLDKPVLVNNYYEFPSFRRAASGLNSTAIDMAKWVIALQGGHLLSGKSLETMWSPSRFNNGERTSWALGWGMNKFRAKHRAVGMSGGGRAAFLIYPDDDLAVIVLTNLGGSYPEDFLEEIAGVYDPEIPAADPVTNLRLNLRKKGFAQAIPFSEQEKKSNPLFRPSEFELNEWAYRMMAKAQYNEAKEILKLNVHLFPQSWNAYDSYGEVMLRMGEKEKAIELYKKSVELNPDNGHGKKVLSDLLK